MSTLLDAEQHSVARIRIAAPETSSSSDLLISPPCSSNCMKLHFTSFAPTYYLGIHNLVASYLFQITTRTVLPYLLCYFLNQISTTLLSSRDPPTPGSIRLSALQSHFSYSPFILRQQIKRNRRLHVRQCNPLQPIET